MKSFFLPLLLTLITVIGYGQTCTITSTQNWVNPGPSCSEGGDAGGKTTLIIPAGLTLTFDTPTDTWTGTVIEVYGTLNITANPSVTVNSSIIVKNGGRLNISGKLELGTTAGCGYYLQVASGGLVDVAGTGTDRLTICGVEIMKGSGLCNSCGGTNSGKCAYDGNPYCEPAGGFAGPTGYRESGYDATLPIKLLYFSAQAREENVNLDWATSKEENFFGFKVQRSADGTSFEDIGEVDGKGWDIENVVTTYSFEDEAPLLGFNYYRLKAVDLDASYEYSNVTAVKISGAKKLAAYPNPTTGDHISFRTNFNPDEADRIIVMNQLGVVVFDGQANSAQNSITFDNTLRAGIYLLKYVSLNFQQTVKVLVQD